MKLFEPPILDILELYRDTPPDTDDFKYRKYPSCRIDPPALFIHLQQTANLRNAKLDYIQGELQGRIHFSHQRLSRSAYQSSPFELTLSPEGLCEKITFYQPTGNPSSRLREEACLYLYHFLRNLCLTLYPEESTRHIVRKGEVDMPTFFCRRWSHTVAHNDYDRKNWPALAQHIHPTIIPDCAQASH
ncbi:MAG: hypothetical protein Q7R96_05800 [Nanoarchaeota archaeon]|nr:hypothetical protein [Nanoarchaeota archaeon]